MGGASQIEYFPLIKEIFTEFIFELETLSHLRDKTKKENSLLFIGILNGSLNNKFNINSLSPAITYVENNLMNLKIKDIINYDSYSYITTLYNKK